MSYQDIGPRALQSIVSHTSITLFNWGLIMSCSSDPSPYVSLFQCRCLPILDGMKEIWKEDMEARLKALGEKKTDKVKRYRNEMKSARVAEQQERKQWTKRQQIIHGYGKQEEDLSAEREEIVDSDSTVYSHIGGVHSMQGDGEAILIVMGNTTEEARGQVPTAHPSRKETM